MFHIGKIVVRSALTLLTVGLMFACNDAADKYYNQGEQPIGEGTVFDYLQSQAEYSEFLALAERVGLTEKLNGNDLITVWAPVNSELPASVADMDDEQLRMLVDNHISATTIFSRNLGRMQTVETHLRKFLTVEQTGTRFTIDGAELTEVDMLFQNGIVHRISEWLVPRLNLQQLIESLPDRFSTFREMIQRNTIRTFDKDNSAIIGIDEKGAIVYDSVWVYRNSLLKNMDLTDESIRYTLFAPDNDAFADMYVEKTDFLKGMGRTVLRSDTTRWVNWMMQASLCAGLIDFDPVNGRYFSIHDNELRGSYQQVEAPTELSNGRFYPMTRCYVPRSLYISRVTYNPYYLRYVYSLINSSFTSPQTGTYDSYYGAVNAGNCSLNSDNLTVFWQYSSNTLNNHYQFKSCSWDESIDAVDKNVPLKIMPAEYEIRVHLVSQTSTGNANLTDLLEFYEIDKTAQAIKIADATGIISGAYDTPDGGLLISNYEIKDYDQLELRIVVPGSYTAGTMRRICVGQVTLIPTDNY